MPEGYYTTGDISRICGVAPRTASKWCDSGKIKSYRLPGSNDRRVKRDDLLAFIADHDLPFVVPGTEEDCLCRVLFVGVSVELSQIREQVNPFGVFSLLSADDCFAAGCAYQLLKPHVVVIDFALGNGDANNMADKLREDKKGLKLFAVVYDDQKASPSFDGVWVRPVNVPSVVEVLKHIAKQVTK